MVDEKHLREELSRKDPRFKRIFDQHQRLDLLIKKIDRHRTLTPQEELSRKQLRVEKLQAKDRMEKMIKNQGNAGVS